MNLYGVAKTNESENTASRLATPEPSHGWIHWRLALILLGFILLLWVIALVYTSVQCGDRYVCSAQDIVFWSLPVLSAATLTIVIVTFGIAQYHKAQTEQYMNALNKHYSYRRGKVYEDRLIAEIALQVAKSLASADMDTYSPTIHKETTAKKEDVPIMLEDDPTEHMGIMQMFRNED